MRLQKLGYCGYDVWIFVLYFPCRRDPAGVGTYRALLDWTEDIRGSLPERCELLALIDGSAHLGSVQVRDACGRTLIGGNGAEADMHLEVCCGTLSRALACRS